MTIELIGYLNWHRKERVSDRYGGIGLALDLADDARSVNLQPAAYLVGQHVTLRAEVLRSVKSHHIGDMFRGISPSQTPKGTVVDLGTGTLEAVEDLDDMSQLVFRRDGRGESDSDWLDPHQLYALHDHCVRLVLEPAQ